MKMQTGGAADNIVIFRKMLVYKKKKTTKATTEENLSPSDGIGRVVYFAPYKPIYNGIMSFAFCSARMAFRVVWHLSLHLISFQLIVTKFWYIFPEYTLCAFTPSFSKFWLFKFFLKHIKEPSF